MAAETAALGRSWAAARHLMGANWFGQELLTYRAEPTCRLTSPEVPASWTGHRQTSPRVRSMSASVGPRLVPRRCADASSSASAGRRVRGEDWDRIAGAHVGAGPHTNDMPTTGCWPVRAGGLPLSIRTLS